MECVKGLSDLLGHASILTTERYDNQKLEALQAAVERLERGKTFEPEPQTTFQESFKFPPKSPFDEDTVSAGKKPATD